MSSPPTPTAGPPPRPKSADFAGEGTLPYPARQADMTSLPPQSDFLHYRPAGKLAGKVALITGGDSGIGRAVAVCFGLEGASVAILYNENDLDARDTQALFEAKKARPESRCLVIKGDVRDPIACRAAVARTVAELGALDILVNNAAYQQAQTRFEDITEEQFRRTFETNVLGYFYLAQAALPHLEKTQGNIVNTGSIVGKTGIPILIDYSATKGAIHAFTRSLALSLGERGIRVNAVVPGPVWTPNIPGTMPESEVKRFGHEVALGRPGQPEELAPAYVFLAGPDGAFVTGALLDVTGGKLSSDG